MSQLTEQQILKIQAGWQSLDIKDKLLAQTIRNLSTYSEQLYDGKEYTDILEEIADIQDELDAIRGEKRVLTWLFSDIAPGWEDL